MPEAGTPSYPEILGRLDTITLGEMDSIKLMNRIDTKYLTDEAHLAAMLRDALGAGYRVLVTEGGRLATYDSVYYDTDDLRMFTDHHNRRLRRQKVRTRCYVASGSTFLEIKRKNNKGRTSKKRMAIPPAELQDFRSDGPACTYLESHSAFTAGELSPVLETMFVRITLVNRAKTERLTIDTRLSFKNFRTGLETDLKDAVIIELKQDGRAESEMKRILLDNRIKPMRVSKYCIAVTLTDPSARSGRFKAKVRRIEKTINKKIETI